MNNLSEIVNETRAEPDHGMDDGMEIIMILDDKSKPNQEPQVQVQQMSSTMAARLTSETFPDKILDDQVRQLVHDWRQNNG
jgi:hypothetical protein